MNEPFKFKVGSPADIMSKQMDFLFNEGRKLAMTPQEAHEKMEELEEDMATDGEHDEVEEKVEEIEGADVRDYLG